MRRRNTTLEMIRVAASRRKLMKTAGVVIYEPVVERPKKIVNKWEGLCVEMLCPKL